MNYIIKLIVESIIVNERLKGRIDDVYDIQKLKFSNIGRPNDCPRAEPSLSGPNQQVNGGLRGPFRDRAPNKKLVIYIIIGN